MERESKIQDEEEEEGDDDDENTERYTHFFKACRYRRNTYTLEFLSS